jgi:hypothetical protein
MTNINKAVILHYNSKLPIKCCIRNDSVDNFFSADLLDGIKLGISKGDPVVVGLMDEGIIKTLGGSIVSANVRDGLVRTIIILADNKVIPFERRKVTRLYTSLYGILSKDNMIVSDICIKDISDAGLCIYANADFEIGEQVEIDMVLQEEVAKIKCSINRKTQKYGKKLYGLIIMQDEESTSAIKQFIEAVHKYYLSLMSVMVVDNQNQ